MANRTTSEFIDQIEITYNGVNYVLSAEFYVDLRDGALILDDVSGYVCDCYWESVTDRTSDLHAAKFDGFREAVTEAARDRIDVDKLRGCD